MDKKSSKPKMKEVCHINTEEPIELDKDGLPVKYNALFQCPVCKSMETHAVGIFKKTKVPVCDCRDKKKRGKE